jgi:hypothetical protein
MAFPLRYLVLREYSALLVVFLVAHLAHLVRSTEAVELVRHALQVLDLYLAFYQKVEQRSQLFLALALLVLVFLVRRLAEVLVLLNLLVA